MRGGRSEKRPPMTSNERMSRRKGGSPTSFPTIPDSQTSTKGRRELATVRSGEEKIQTRRLRGQIAAEGQKSSSHKGVRRTWKTEIIRPARGGAKRT